MTQKTPEELEFIENHPMTKAIRRLERRVFTEGTKMLNREERGAYEMRIARDKIVEAAWWLEVALLARLGTR